MGAYFKLEDFTVAKKKKELTYADFEAKQPVAKVDGRIVKIRALREIEIDKKLILAGKEVLVTEDEATEFCDRSFDGYIPCYGYLPEMGPLLEGGNNPLDRKKIVRAVRVA